MEKELNKTFLSIESNLSKFRKVPWIIGRNAFLVILILILLDIILGGILSYKYVNLAGEENIENNEGSLKFHDENYKNILDSWDKRNTGLQEFLKKDYVSPF